MIKFLPGVIAFAMLGLLILQWKDWPPPPSQAGLGEEPATSSAPSEQAPDPLAGLKPPGDKEDYVSVIERPLFRPDRRPEPPPDEEPEAPPTPEPSIDLDNMDLSAVMITPTIISAWVRDPNQPKLRRLRIGDDFEGWSVRDILEDRVLLERQGEQDALILRDYTKMPSVTARKPVPRRPARAARPSSPPRQ